MVEDPSEVLSHLHGLDYPASKQELISAAEARGARQEVIEALQVLEQERFADREAVEEALASGPRL
ncbi:MAG: DUF2795 domain-containing protein [Actinomycetota bacterium]|nr:DUF2795 domain-containing protein [Actinomycetota bacterium]